MTETGEAKECETGQHHRPGRRLGNRNAENEVRRCTVGLYIVDIERARRHVERRCVIDGLKGCEINDRSTPRRPGVDGRAVIVRNGRHAATRCPADLDVRVESVQVAFLYAQGRSQKVRQSRGVVGVFTAGAAERA